MAKKSVTTLVHERTILALRLWAQDEGLIVRRGPRPGEASIAKLLDKLAAQYLLQAAQETDKSKGPQFNQRGADVVE